ncbi:CaaX prenyl protein-like proteinase Rce1 [Amniculicola lignicola CBS 123094]|uniref:intramembrane prenyl-peptidase Rce1 n=1 Tax=Amniculicola lignicola CBS 123094 TaxID=1392246 RepID=A0A6A5W7V4_9PLEO|nr:CaaX prenyl protein-like proteinase Rce1 [Amniculicola lignicola CBS 123094]
MSNVSSAQKPPVIAPSTAATLSVLFTVIYVVPFYLSAATRPSLELSRDAPSSIRARIRAVTFSSVVSLALTVYVLHHYGNASPKEVLKLLGVWPVSLVDTAKTILLVAILFAGPLFEAGIVEGGLKYWIRGTRAYETLSSWIGYRNLVVVCQHHSRGPVTEELIWRSLVIPLHILARFSGKQIIFLTPLYFGIAHAHHLYEFRLTHPRTPMFMAILRSVFQFAYTSLFGFFAAFVFLRTGNLLSIILAHSFCNVMGLPRFWGRVGVEAGVPVGPTGLGKDDEGQGSQSKSVAWTAAYYVILVAGAVGFYLFLFPLTGSSYALPVVLIEE